MPIEEQILTIGYEYDYDCEYKQAYKKSLIKCERRDRESSKLSDLMDLIGKEDQLRLRLAGEKGASSWLSVLPIKEFGFMLHKRNFVDAIHLRYGWLPRDMPTLCACGVKFTVEHSLSCLKGGFIHGRHNELRDFTANLLTETCHDVLIEPTLQPVLEKESLPLQSNTRDDARLDIGMNGFWGGRFERNFVDVRVFNPFAPSNKNQCIKDTYRKHENEKKKFYEKKIIEKEHASFTPLVFSVTGGMAGQCTLFYQRLASLISVKRSQPYSQTLNWIRCCTSFILLRSTIQCIRGARSSFHCPQHHPTDLVYAESKLGCHID